MTNKSQLDSEDAPLTEQEASYRAEKWRQLQQLRFDKKKLTKRAKRVENVTVKHAHKFIVKRLDSIRNVRRQIISWFVLVGLVIAAVGVQLMWFQQGYKTEAGVAGGTYAEAVRGSIDTLNPLYASSDAEVAASRLMFSSLYNYDTTGHLRGDLATAIVVDASSKVYTVTIRSDATWHDGVRLTAKDIAYTVNLIKNPQARSPLAVSWQDVTVQVMSDTTLQFQLPAVYAAFPYALTFAILPQHILGEVAAASVRESTFSRAPLGSGPFSFSALQSPGVLDHTVVQTKAFDRYYAGTPKLSRFEIHAHKTNDAVVKALRAGEVSAAVDVSPSDAASFDTTAYKVAAHSVNNGVYALLNSMRPVLKDKAVRAALQLATDTDALRADLNNGAPKLDLPFVEGQLTGVDTPRRQPANIVAAGLMLDRAGWVLADGVRQKDGQKLTLTITTTKDDQYVKVVKTLTSQWERIGVAVQTRVVDRTNPSVNFTQDVLQQRNYDVLVYELLIGGDPDVYAYWHSSQIGANGYNFANYTNPTADAALSSARSRVEPSLRNAKYVAFARQWLDDVPAIGLYQPVVTYVANKHVHAADEDAVFVSSTDRYGNILDWTVRQDMVYKTP